MAETTVPIPGPPGLPLIGNVNDIDPNFPLGSLVNMADKYGEIYRMNLAGRSVVVVSSYALVNEVCNEKRFQKDIRGVLEQVRAGVHDGLFTARGPEEPNWSIAHRVLMPAFGPMPINDMFDDMHDIACQLAMKWARHGPAYPIKVTDDFTRLALDTLALCSMDYRFNSFYHDEMHPFIEAMGGFLVESGNRSRRPLPALFYREVDRKYQQDIDIMRKTADDVLQFRKEHPSDRKDLLSAMMSGVDPKTGQKMTDQSITDNLITFLIAGHETTGGTLSFAFYNLLKHPEAYRKAQQEVDQVVGDGPITVEHTSKLQYIQAILRETLRLTPTIASIAVKPVKDELVGGGKYAVHPTDTLVMLMAKSQVDPAVFGETAHDFQPERLLEANFNQLNREFPNSWKPFGNGQRGCIGRPFAWQEATLAIALLLQNFNFLLDDPSYILTQQQTLTVKPKDFYMRAVLRHGLTATKLEQRLSGSTSSLETSVAQNNDKTPPGASPKKGKPLSIYYGSNSGTCEALARRLATDAPTHGFQATTVDSLDAAHQNLPTDQPVVILTASYEGEPPDNAALFCHWLQGLGEKQEDKKTATTPSQQQGEQLDKVSYAVFGCGHHDWASTFHKIPKMVDATLAALGSTRLAPLGVADAAEGDLFTRFESWEDEQLWPALRARYGTEEDEDQNESGGLTVEISTPRSSTLRQDVKEAVVLATRDLTTPPTQGEREGEVEVPTKKHIEIQLPSDKSYAAGDYLAVLPLNPPAIVQRALRRFRLPWDAHVTIRAATATTLPTGHPVPASDVLGAYVELSQPATRRSLLVLAEATPDEAAATTRAELLALANGTSTGTGTGTGDGDSANNNNNNNKKKKKSVHPRWSVLDLLEAHPAIELPFATFLSLLPPLRVRQYSISSSPRANPSACTLTYAVLDAPARSYSPSTSTTSTATTTTMTTTTTTTIPGRRHQGVATSYLASLQPGDKLHVAVRPSHASFHLPVDSERTPLVMIAAGTGLAPFRGFIQERAALLLASGSSSSTTSTSTSTTTTHPRLAPALLFFGCRHPAHDDLYRAELDAWEKLGAVDVRRAYSRLSHHEESKGCAHVDERLWHDRRDVQALWERGAKVYVCGSRGVAEAVRAVAIRMYVDGARENHGKELSVEEATDKFDAVRYERFATDVFD